MTRYLTLIAALFLGACGDNYWTPERRAALNDLSNSMMYQSNVYAQKSRPVFYQTGYYNCYPLMGGGYRCY